MEKLRVAVIGFGRLGHACVREMAGRDRLSLAGVVRHEVGAQQARAGLRVAAHARDLGPIDLALVCVPPQHVAPVAHDLMQQRIRVIECAQLHGAAYEVHKREFDRMAAHFKVPVAVGAGWDPGALSLFRSLFALLLPHGHTTLSHHPGIALHHSTIAGAIPGVRKALSTERSRADGSVQRYVYLELAPGASPEGVTQAIRNDPLFAGDEMLIFPESDVSDLEDRDHGALLERRSAHGEHGHLLLETRGDEATLAARVMVAAADALPRSGARAYSLLDLPVGALWGDASGSVERDWI